MTLYPFDFLDQKAVDSIAHWFCKVTAGAICKLTVDILAGTSKFDDPKAITNLTGHFPAGTSSKSLNHYEQLIIHGGFRDYDYGKNKNQEIYHSDTPPEFDMTKISVPTALFVGSVDTMADPDDVNTLREFLPTDPKILTYHQIFDDFSHETWMVGNSSAFSSWFPDLKNLLQTYNPVAPPSPSPSPPVPPTPSPPTPPTPSPPSPPVPPQQCASAGDRQLGGRGKGYKDFMHHSPAQCCSECQKDPKCKSFAYFVTKRHHCYFYDNDNDVGPAKKGHTSYRVAKFTEVTV